MHPNHAAQGPTHQLSYESHPGVTRLGLILVVLTGLLMAWFAGPVLMQFPHSGDEYAYQYQARTFLEGRVVNPPAPDPEAFAQIHVVSTPEGMYSKYPPGWPVVLALGEAVGAGFLVNPFLAALSLWVLFGLARRTLGDREALVGLVLLATNGMFLLNGASFFSHPLAGLLMAFALLALLRFHRSPTARGALALGAALGGLALARPQDGIVVTVALVPLALLATREEPWAPRLRQIGALVLVPAVLGGLYLLYNQATTGDPLLFGHIVLDSSDHPQWYPPAMVGATVNRLQEYLVLGIAGLASLLVVVPRRGDQGPAARRAIGVAVLVIVLFWLGYAFYIKPDGGPRFGPRYLYPAHLLILVLAGAGMVRAVARPWLTPVVALFAVLQLGQALTMADSAHQTVLSATGLARATDALGEALAPEQALVLVEGPAGSVPDYDLIRNDVDYAGPVLRVLADPSPDLLPERWLYRWDGLGGPPVLIALDPQAPVQMLILTGEGPVIRGRDAETGWVVLEGSSACHRYLWEFPGSRPAPWAEFGPCPGIAVSVGWPPGPGENWVNGGEPRRTAQYRSFLHTERPGRYTVRLRANGALRIKVDGVVVLDSVLLPEGRVVELGLDLEAGAHALEISFASLKKVGGFTWSLLDPSGREVPPELFTTGIGPAPHGDS